MTIYMVSIFGGNIAIILLNYFFNANLADLSFWWILVASVIGTIGVIAIDGVFATLIRWCMPNKWYDYKVDFHKVSKKETIIYEKLFIKAWKDKILELGMFTSFSKKKVEDPQSREYIERFILECNYGAVIHLADAIFGFLLLLCYMPFSYPMVMSIGMPICIINAILNILPLMILRYNLYRLHKLRDILEKKEKRTNQ